MTHRRFSSLTYLNITQFQSALNDNLYKIMLAFFAIDMLGLDHATTILAMAGAVFVAPFLLFSAWGGTLADRYSKQRIIVIAKALELVFMVIGTICLGLGSVVGGYVTLFLMSSQSAIFSPCKYGIIREIVPLERLSRANSLVTGFTYMAVIIGTFLASSLTDLTHHRFGVAMLACIAFALVGFFTALRIEKTPAAGSKHKAHPLFFYEIYRNLKDASANPLILTAILGSSFFLFLGAYTQLNMIPYAISIGLSAVQGGYIFLITAFGIGLGTYVGARISGKSPELGLIPVAGIGLIVFMALLANPFNSVAEALLWAGLLGLSGGAYLLPLDTFIQASSSSHVLGKNIAAVNFLGFVGVLLASVLLWVVESSAGFLAIAGVSLVVIFAMTWILWKRLSAFWGRCRRFLRRG